MVFCTMCTALDLIRVVISFRISVRLLVCWLGGCPVSVSAFRSASSILMRDPKCLPKSLGAPLRRAPKLDPSEINKRASIPPPGDDEFQNVLLVEGSIASTEPLLISMNVKEIIKFKKNFLRKLRPAIDGHRDEWERFVAIQIDAREGMSMYPRLLPGATVLIDRHYRSLKPYRKGESNMYAVNKNEGCTVRYVEVAGKHLVLRPHNNAYPVEVMPIQHGKKPPDYLIGRICYVGIET
jgi:Peptidase S24-like